MSKVVIRLMPDENDAATAWIRNDNSLLTRAIDGGALSKVENDEVPGLVLSMYNWMEKQANPNFEEYTEIDLRPEIGYAYVDIRTKRGGLRLIQQEEDLKYASVQDYYLEKNRNEQEK